MKLSLHIHEGLLNLFSSKLRSILALLGILVGTASVVAMVSGGELATNEALKQFKTLGVDLLAITLNDASDQDQSEANNQATLSLQQAEKIISLNSSLLEVAPYTQVYDAILYGGHEISAGILGVTDQLSSVMHIHMKAGRFVSTLDRYAYYCVIGNGIAEQLKKYTLSDPIGQQLQIGKDFFTIVGVADAWPENSFIYANINFSILIPLLASTSLNKYASINNVIVRLVSHADIDDAKDSITQYLNKLLPHKNLYFRSAKELIAKMSKQSEILTIFLGMIGGISLLVGGIGVMNIMLVSIVERRREIGIRLAVGAKRSDIRTLFLVEAVMLSLLGGGLGVVVGVLIAYVIALISHWEFSLLLLPPFIGFTVSAATGIFFGFYPAYKAAQLDPIEALRSE